MQQIGVGDSDKATTVTIFRSYQQTCLTALKRILLAFLANDVSGHKLLVSRVGYQFQVVLRGRSMSVTLAYECTSPLLDVDVVVA